MFKNGWSDIWRRIFIVAQGQPSVDKKVREALGKTMHPGANSALKDMRANMQQDKVQDAGISFFENEEWWKEHPCVIHYLINVASAIVI